VAAEGSINNGLFVAFFAVIVLHISAYFDCLYSKYIDVLCHYVHYCDRTFSILLMVFNWQNFPR